MELVRTGLAACADAGVEFIVVLGEPSYYRRVGFQKVSLLGIENEYGAANDLMIAPLRAETLASGLAKYASEFADVLPIERNPALTRSLPSILAVRCRDPERY